MSENKKVIKVNLKRESKTGKLLTAGLLIIKSDMISQEEMDMLAKKINDGVNNRKVVTLCVPSDAEAKYFKV